MQTNCSEFFSNTALDRHHHSLSVCPAWQCLPNNQQAKIGQTMQRTVSQPSALSSCTIERALGRRGFCTLRSPPRPLPAPLSTCHLELIIARKRGKYSVSDIGPAQPNPFGETEERCRSGLVCAGLVLVNFVLPAQHVSDEIWRPTSFCLLAGVSSFVPHSRRRLSPRILRQLSCRLLPETSHSSPAKPQLSLLSMFSLARCPQSL